MSEGAMSDEFIFWVFCWCVWGWASSAVSRSKGWESPDGFILGFLLGPFGLLIVCCWENRGKQNSESSPIPLAEFKQQSEEFMPPDLKAASPRLARTWSWYDQLALPMVFVVMWAAIWLLASWHLGTRPRY
jgi:hypothetical protein